MGKTRTNRVECDMTLDPGQIRQGDVFLRRCEALPDGLVEEGRDRHRRVVLAHGERTGHAHAFRSKEVCGLRMVESAYPELQGKYDFILVGGGGARLAHEHVDGRQAEHHPIEVPAGGYEVLQQVEYTPAELVRVAD